MIVTYYLTKRLAIWRSCVNQAFQDVAYELSREPLVTTPLVRRANYSCL
jgi:hypothetical protein